MSNKIKKNNLWILNVDGKKLKIEELIEKVEENKDFKVSNFKNKERDKTKINLIEKLSKEKEFKKVIDDLARS